MKKLILIFDFDGTIANTLPHMIKIGNKLSEKFHFKKIEPAEIEILKDKTSQEIIKHLQIPILKIPMIAAQAKKDLHKEIALIEPKQGLKEILRQLKSSNCQMGILTSNSLKNVTKFLEKHALNVFDFITPTSKIWSKNISLKRVIKKYRLSQKDIIYIGDEIRDIIAAKKAGVQTGAVTWGYNSQKALKKHNPDYLINTPQELLQLLSVK